MQAINHAATALILKRKFPSAPLFGLILATEAVEFLWVGLNLVGIEKTQIADNMRSVSDVHLLHMPFSHSLVSTVIFAIATGLIILWHHGKLASAMAIGLALAVASHVVLDLLVHAPDIALTPYLGSAKLGSGLYANLPLPALILETLWGILCWSIYRGSKKLLALIIGLGVAAIPLYSVSINIGEAALSGHSNLFATIILVQMLLTSVLVWVYAKPSSKTPARSTPT